MIAKALVFVCAVIGLVSGNCYEIRAQQPCSQQLVSIPVINEPSCSSGSVIADNIFPSRSSFINNVCQSESVSAPVCSGTVVSAPVFSDNSFSCGSTLNAPVACNTGDIFSTGSSCSAPVLSVGSCSTPFVASGSAGSFDGSNYNLQVLANNGVSNDFLSNGFGVNGIGAFVGQSSNGPETPAYPVIQAPSVTLQTVESPLITLSSPPIPAPRVIAQKCICTKTIVKPQVIQRCITVPKVQRYLKRTVTPVIENVAYKSKPINTYGAQVEQSPVVLSSGSVASGSCNTGFYQSGVSKVC